MKRLAIQAYSLVYHLVTSILITVYFGGTLQVTAQPLANKMIDSGPPNQGIGIVKLSDGNYVHIASNKSMMQYQQWSSQSGGFSVVKTDSAGNLIYSQKFYSTVTPNVTHVIEDLKELPGSELILTGSFSDNSNFEWMIWIMKLDASGNPVWNFRTTNSGGLTIMTKPSQLFILPSGNILVCGGFSTSFTGVHGNYFLEVDPNGAFVRHHLINTGRTMLDINGFQDSSGNVFMPYNHIGFMVRDTSGVITGYYNIATPTYKDTTSVRRLIMGSTGNVLHLTSVKNSQTNDIDFAVTSFSTGGTFQWMKIYRTPLKDFAWNITPINNGYFICSHMEQNSTTGIPLFTFIDTSGNIVSTASSVQHGYLCELFKVNDNSYAITGKYQGAVSGSNSYSLKTFILTDSSLSNLCLIPYPLITDTAFTPTVFNNGSISATNGASVSMTPYTVTPTANTTHTIYDVCQTSFAESASEPLQLSCYPVPFQDHMIVSIEKPGGIIMVIDPTGKVVHHSIPGSSRLVIPTGNWALGLYTVMYLEGSTRFTARVIKSD